MTVEKDNTLQILASELILEMCASMQWYTQNNILATYWLYDQIFHKQGNASLIEGFPCGSAGKESACHAGDLGEKYIQSFDLKHKIRNRHKATVTKVTRECKKD